MTALPRRLSRIPLEKSVKILCFDSNLIVALEKPCGILSQPNKPILSNSKKKEHCLLFSGSYDDKEFYKFQCLDDDGIKVTDKFWLLNRLDSATSGIILGACDEKIATIVKKLFKEREVNKAYYARVFGKLQSTNSTVWENQMSIQKSGGSILAVGPKSSKFDPRSSKIAQTAVRPVEFDKRTNTSLIELNPLTGFSHQLRFQCSHYGHPIVGDKVYGDYDSNKTFQDLMKVLHQSTDASSKRNFKRLMLHSHSIKFDYGDADSNVHNFSAASALPSEFHLK